MKTNYNNTNFIKPSMMILTWCFFVIAASAAMAGNVSGLSIGAVASNLTSSFTQLGNAITGASYVAGLGFSIGAIMKFKQHKDNPTQIPIGTPIALIFIAAALLFLPSILGTAGTSMFGTTGGSTAGPTGINLS